MKMKRKLAYFILAMFFFSLIPIQAVKATASDSNSTDTRKKYEDTNKGITYNGNWSEDSNSNFSSGSSKYSNTKGDSITFEFEGTGFALYGLANNTRGFMDITIDDGFTSRIDPFNSSAIYQKNIYEAFNLKNDKHSVKITVTGEKNSNSTNTYVSLDFIEIINGTLINADEDEPEPTLELKAGTIISSVSNSTDGSYTITGKIPANNAASSYEIFEGNTSIKSGELTANNSEEVSVVANLSDKKDGNYTYKLVLKDSKGNVKESNSVTVTVKIEIVTPPDDDTTVGPKEIIVYFPNWGIYNSSHQSMVVGQIPWDKVTYVNHAFFTLDKSFNLVSTDPEADFDRIMDHSEGWGGLNGHMAEYRYYKTQYPDVNVMISVGGWTRGENFHDMAKTAETRKVFINSCVDFLKKYPFIDGIDIDWEYPGIDREKDPNDQYDYGCPGGPEDRENFPLLLKELREAFDNNGLADKKLTAAVPAGKDKIDQVDPATYEQYLDILNIMTYDFHGAWENVTGHHSPLYGSEYEPYDDLIKNYYNVNAAMEQYVKAGVSKDKLIVGSPFYSRGWTGVDMSKGVTIDGKFYPGLYQSATGAWTGGWDNPQVPGGQEGWFTVKKFETTAGWEKYRDPINNSPYLINKNSGVFLTYEDEVSLEQKLNYINDKGFGGVIIWDVSGDSIADKYPLLTLCHKLLIDEPIAKLPTKTNLSVDKSTNKGNYTLAATIPANSKANSYELYEGNKVVKSGNVSTSSLNVSFNVSDKAPGKYDYKLVLKNENGNMPSDILTVTVIDATTPEVGTLEASATVTEGDVTLTITAADNLATDYKLYQNNEVVSEGKLVDGKATVELKALPYDTYAFKAELINSSSNQSSFTEPVTVRVKAIPKEWTENASYKVGDLVTYKGIEYECVIPHTALYVWPPDGGGATLWKVVDTY